jgi:hypothetical protein
MGRSCWQSWARASGEAQLCQQPGPKLLAKLGIFPPFLLLFSSI